MADDPERIEILSILVAAELVAPAVRTEEPRPELRGMAHQV